MEGPTGLTIDEPTREELEDVVVRFAGDSGDGVQITGGQFTLTTERWITYDNVFSYGEVPLKKVCTKDDVDAYLIRWHQV